MTTIRNGGQPLSSMGRVYLYHKFKTYYILKYIFKTRIFLNFLPPTTRGTFPDHQGQSVARHGLDRHLGSRPFEMVPEEARTLRIAGLVLHSD
jgi:hypothetical protein